jgi:hypothetical protein
MFRSAISSSTSRKLSENRMYQRTQVTITAGSNCRLRNSAGRQEPIASHYQTKAATLPFGGPNGHTQTLPPNLPGACMLRVP